MKFRNLKPEEIECRVGQMKKDGTGCSLLLYKTARTDANILDETVEPENWTVRHYEVKGKDFAEVGIRIGEDWIFKSDCGEESNIEARKGESSDALKRSCVLWGIGRSLYSTPDIWVKLDSKETSSFNGKFSLASSVEFKVKTIEYDDIGNICILQIVKTNYGKDPVIVFDWKSGKNPIVGFDYNLATMSLVTVFDKLIVKDKFRKYGVVNKADMTEDKFNKIREELFEYVRTNSNK